MLECKTYICRKCGWQFMKTVGGVAVTPKQMELEMCPVCDRCKLAAVKKAISIFKK